MSKDLNKTGREIKSRLFEKRRIHSWTVHRDSLGPIAIVITSWGDYACRFALDSSITEETIRRSTEHNWHIWHRWDVDRNCFLS